METEMINIICSELFLVQLFFSWYHYHQVSRKEIKNIMKNLIEKISNNLPIYLKYKPTW